MATLEQVRKDAMSLCSEDRELLAVELTYSIEKAPGYEEAWAAEIKRCIRTMPPNGRALRSSCG